jgi:hypothetical protein
MEILIGLQNIPVSNHRKNALVHIPVQPYDADALEELVTKELKTFADSITRLSPRHLIVMPWYKSDDGREQHFYGVGALSCVSLYPLLSQRLKYETPSASQISEKKGGWLLHHIELQHDPRIAIIDEGIDAAFGVALRDSVRHSLYTQGYLLLNTSTKA